MIRTRFRAARQAQRMRREDVAVAAGCCLATVERLELGRGITHMRLSTMLRFADALGVPAVELIPALGLKHPLRAVEMQDVARVNLEMDKLREAGPRAPIDADDSEFDRG